MASATTLEIGDPIPWFSARTIVGATIDIHVDAGRHVVLSFMGDPPGPEADFDQKLGDLLCLKPSLGDDRIVCYGILSSPPPARSLYWLIDNPSLAFLADYDGALARQMGVGRPVTLILDPMLRLVAELPYDMAAGHGMQLGQAIRALGPPLSAPGMPEHAPVLLWPGVFEPAFCHRLMAYYRDAGGRDSGFLLDRGGITQTVTDYKLKRRTDCALADEPLMADLRARLVRRLLPAIERSFGFKATRMDRYLIARYDGGTGDHFFRHRDNLNAGAAHRRFAVTINLNAEPENYQGGEVRFPEFGATLYRGTSGGAIVFSCGLLHEVLPVRQGERFAFLAFLYGEAEAAIRAANNARLAEGERLYEGHDRLFPGEDVAGPAAQSSPPPADETASLPAAEGAKPDPCGWVPIQATVKAGGAAIEWLEPGGLDFTQPFFSQSVALRQAEIPAPALLCTGPEVLERLAGASGLLPPSGLIFHMSRCGSTLVSRSLAALADCLVLSEPDPVNDVLGPVWGGAEDRLRQKMIKDLLLVLGWPRRPGQSRSFVKFSSWNGLFLPLLTGLYPSLPKLFVYRDPVEVMVSLLNEPPGWLKLKSDPLLSARFSGYAPQAIAWMSTEEYGAKLLGRILDNVAAALDPSWKLVNYDELPEACYGLIPGHFGLEPGEAGLAAMRGLSGVHAKDRDGTRPFADDRAAKRRAATPSIVAAVEQWLAPSYQRLEALRRLSREGEKAGFAGGPAGGKALTVGAAPA